MTKKKYLSPDAKVIKVKPAEIICTSGPVKTNEVQFEDYEDGEFSWD